MRKLAKTFDAFGTEAAPTTLTAANVFGSGILIPPEFSELVLYVHYDPANSG